MTPAMRQVRPCNSDSKPPRAIRGPSSASAWVGNTRTYGFGIASSFPRITPTARRARTTTSFCACGLAIRTTETTAIRVTARRGIGDGVGTNTTSRIPDWLSFSDRGKEITYVMHVRVDSIGKPGAQNYPLNKGNGALEAWKNGKQFISLTDISWRCTRGAEYFTNGYVLGWDNSGFRSEEEFLLREFS